MADAKPVLDYLQEHEKNVAQHVFLTQPVGGGQVKSRGRLNEVNAEQVSVVPARKRERRVGGSGF